MKTFVWLPIFFIALWAVPLRSDDTAVRLDNVKSVLRSDTANPAKKLAAIQLYIKTRKELSKEDLQFFKEAILSPKLCASKDILQCLGATLLKYPKRVDKKTLDEQLLDVIEKSSDKKYSVWGLEFYITHPKMEAENVAAEILERNKRAAEIAKRDRSAVFVEAIKQHSPLASSSSICAGLALAKDKDVSDFLDAALTDASKTKNIALMEYIRDNTPFLPHISEANAHLLSKIAGDASAPQKFKELASNILSAMFFIPPPSNWEKWYLENAETFDKKSAAEKALLSKTLDGKVKTAALKYLLKVHKNKIDRSFAEKLKQTAEESDSPELCFAIASALRANLSNGDMNESDKQLYSSIWKICHAVCAKHNNKHGKSRYFLSSEIPKTADAAR